MRPETEYQAPPAARWAGTIVPFEPPLLRIRYPHGVYVTLVGYPDWLPYARAYVDVPVGEPDLPLDQLRVADVVTANATMAHVGDPLWERGEDGVALTPDGWLWQHLPYDPATQRLPDRRRMALLPAEVAVAFRHAGGLAELWPDRPGAGLAAPLDSAPVGFLPAEEQVAAEDLDALQRDLPGPLPAPYREFLLRTGGGRPRVAAVHPEVGFVLDQSFLRGSRSRKSQLASVNYLRRWCGDRFTEDFLAIARVQGGLIALRLTGSDAGSVWFWDADDPRDDDRYDAAVVSRELLRRCADSFDEFLAVLRPVPRALAEQAQAAIDEARANAVFLPEMGASLLAKDRAAMAAFHDTVRQNAPSARTTKGTR